MWPRSQSAPKGRAPEQEEGGDFNSAFESQSAPVSIGPEGPYSGTSAVGQVLRPAAAVGLNRPRRAVLRNPELRALVEFE